MHLGLSGWQREALNGNPRQLLDLFEHADRLGFDSIWFNEYHFRRKDLPYPSAIALAASVIGRSERMRVGLSVVLLPIHHPLLLAEELAQLDCQSGGRLDVGIGRGTPDIRRVFGLSETESTERLEAGLELLIAAWTQPVVASDGPYWRFPAVEVGPSPVQQPHPPVFVAGSTESTLRLAVERGLPLLLSLEPPEARQLIVARKTAEALRVSLNLAGSSLGRYVCIAPSRGQALAEADALRVRLHERRRFFARQRGEDPDALQARSLEQFSAEQAIIGAPDDCVRQLQELTARTGMNHLRCMFNGAGSIPLEAARRAMELFAAEVLPVCRAFSAGTVRSTLE
ncbi:MAG: LLM class flavin-dependent oxidoreductase [Chloroflexi bacterium]|nr:LLM class flavin-dependent oxidoreductase [Chloroflexota bacterium]